VQVIKKEFRNEVYKLKSIYFIMDPAYIFPINIENTDRLEMILKKFVFFFDEISEIEDKIISRGSYKKFFKFSFQNKFRDKYFDFSNIFNLLPRCKNKQLKSTFYNTIFKKLLSRLNLCIKENLDDISSTIEYNNPYISTEIKNFFNEFLNTCSNNRNESCNCSPIPIKYPFFICENTLLNQKQQSFDILQRIEEIYSKIPILYIYPKKEDNLDYFEKKFRLMLEISSYRKLNKRTILDNFQFLYDFWRSDLLFLNDDDFKSNLIEVMSHLILNPESRDPQLHRERYNHDWIRINGRRFHPDSVYIYQSVYVVGGKEFTPRLLFRIIDGVIYFHSLINRH